MTQARTSVLGQLAVVTSLLALAAVGCRQSADPSSVQAGNVRQARPTTNDVVAGASGTLVPVCRIHTLRLEDVSSPAFLDQSRVHEGLVASLEGRFGAMGAGGNGLEMRVEYLVYRRQQEEDVLFLGARALLRYSDSSSELAWEAAASADMPTPPGCVDGPTSPSCATLVIKTLLPRVAEQLAYRSHLACSLETAAANKVEALFTSKDPWERTQAAKIAGERRLSQLVVPLTKLLNDPEYGVVLSAIGALGRLQSDSAIDPLVMKAARAPSDVVHAIAVALLDSGVPRAREYVREWAGNHPLPEVRERCLQLLSLDSPGP